MLDTTVMVPNKTNIIWQSDMPPANGSLTRAYDATT